MGLCKVLLVSTYRNAGTILISAYVICIAIQLHQASKTWGIPIPATLYVDGQYGRYYDNYQHYKFDDNVFVVETYSELRSVVEYSADDYEFKMRYVLKLDLNYNSNYYRIYQWRGIWGVLVHLALDAALLMFLPPLYLLSFVINIRPILVALAVLHQNLDSVGYQLYGFPKSLVLFFWSLIRTTRV